MRKRDILLLCITIFLALSLMVLGGALSLESFSRDNVSVWTKAICNEDNYCIDVRITCRGGRIAEISPVQEGVHFPDEWRDTRTDELRERWC